MIITGENMIRFSGIDYTYKVTLNLETIYVSPGVFVREVDTAFVPETFTTSSLEVSEMWHGSFPVENDILDRFSETLSMEFDEDMFKTLIEIANRLDDNR